MVKNGEECGCICGVNKPKSAAVADFVDVKMLRWPPSLSHTLFAGRDHSWPCVTVRTKDPARGSVSLCQYFFARHSCTLCVSSVQISEKESLPESLSLDRVEASVNSSGGKRRNWQWVSDEIECQRSRAESEQCFSTFLRMRVCVYVLCM